MTFKRTVDMNITFDCECGHILCTKNLHKIRCEMCGRLYSTQISEHLHNRLYIDDKLAAIDMMSVSSAAKEDIKDFARKRILEDSSERS